MAQPEYDAVVIGAGPNGLAAAIVLAEAGRSVFVIERAETVGGGARTAELTLPGYRHDICSAIHPMAVASPFFANLPLEKFGLRWRHASLPLAHPLDDGTAAVLHRSLAATAEGLGDDGSAWTALMEPFLDRADALFADILRPARIPTHPLLMGRFGLVALRSCAALVRSRFRTEHARSLFAGCATHSFLPLEAPSSAAIGMVLALVGHARGWPFPEGGSQRIADALTGYFCSLGGTVHVGHEVRTLADVPHSRVVLFDLVPQLVDRIVGDALPAGFRRTLRSFRRGPGVFKIDWALTDPIPWRAPACRGASTIHVGGLFEDIAASERERAAGRIPDRPFVLLAQQSIGDASRAPAGHHTGWAYCHVPTGATIDMTDRIERQVERFAPGFRDVIVARHTLTPADLERGNPNLIGGDISGGANDLAQFLFRPSWRWDPYSTPNPRLFLCSSSTPPGGGVHGMCGYWAARSALMKCLS